MKAGYTIQHILLSDALSDRDNNTAFVKNYHGSNLVSITYADSIDEGEFIHATPCEDTVAIFRLRYKVECDKCGECTKDTQDAAGNTYCQSCEDNLNEERARRYYNDAENFTTPNYSQYKSLK